MEKQATTVLDRSLVTTCSPFFISKKEACVIKNHFFNNRLLVDLYNKYPSAELFLYKKWFIFFFIFYCMLFYSTFFVLYPCVFSLFHEVFSDDKGNKYKIKGIKFFFYFYKKNFFA
jgi:hypothetical protein